VHHKYISTAFILRIFSYLPFIYSYGDSNHGY
jgi:hypothetical protein